MDTVEERCRNVMAKVMNVDAATLGNDASPLTLDKWDSLAHVQLVLALEDEFSLQIPPEDGIEHMASLGKIIAYMRNRT